MPPQVPKGGIKDNKKRTELALVTVTGFCIRYSEYRHRRMS